VTGEESFGTLAGGRGWFVAPQGKPKVLAGRKTSGKAVRRKGNKSRRQQGEGEGILNAKGKNQCRDGREKAVTEGDVALPSIEAQTEDGKTCSVIHPPHGCTKGGGLHQKTRTPQPTQLGGGEIAWEKKG